MKDLRSLIPEAIFEGGIMQALRSLFAIILLIGITTWLAACGGGGGGGGFSYEGNTSQAVITTTNAARLVATALGDTTASNENTATRETSGVYAQKASQAHLSSRLSRHVRDTLTQTIAARSSELRTTTGVAIDETEWCESGSIHYTGTINNDGTGTVNARYNDCRYGDETWTGYTTLRATAYDLSYGIFTDSTFSYSPLTVSTSTFNVSYSGSERSQVTIGTNTERLTFNLVTRDNTTGFMTKTENLVIVDVYDNIFVSPPTFSETLTGRVFDSVYGYVDVTTPVPLYFYRWPNSYASSGQLLLTGAGNASISFTVFSSAIVMLELDLDGDTVFESTASISWFELFAGSDLSDSDGDGMHDGWETANGLDPLNPTDATQDADADGFSNIEEYLAGSDPNNASSMPPTADLTISKTFSGNTAAGSVSDYLLTVSNLGLQSANNVVVMDTLPPESTYMSASGIGWSCNETSGTVACTRGNLAVGVAPVITISIMLPLTPGNISNTATVSSVTTDPDPANNSDTVVTAIVSLAPSENLGLGADAFDMELDSARQQLYVSVPGLNLINIISLNTFTVTNSIVVGDSPHGIDLSPDGNTLYVALNQSGTVAALDLNALALTEIVVAVELNTSLVYDVIAPDPELVFASGNPGSSGFAYIVEIDTANSNQVSRVANNRIIRSNPFFAANLNPQSIYVGEGFSPNSVYKLDLSQTGVPLVLEDAHGSVSGSYHLDVNADGSKLMTASGQILDTDTLTQSGTVGNGVSVFSSDGISATVGESPNSIGIYNLSTGLRTDKQYTTCNMTTVDRIMELQADLEWILLGQQTLCRVSAPNNIDPLPAVADLVINTTVTGDLVAGGSLSYQLSINNQGPIQASNVQVTNTLPPGTGFVSATSAGWSCIESGGTVTCTRGTLAVGVAPVITISVMLPLTPGNISNTASVLSATTDPDNTNNSDSVNTLVVAPGSSVSLDLGATVFDMELDNARQQLYVSVPTLNSIEVVSLDTFTVTSSIPVGTSPHGIDLSPDGNTLYVALSQPGRVGVVDLDTLTITQIDVSTELNVITAHDVIAPTSDEIFVSGSSGSAFIVRIDTANSNQATRVASNRVIRAGPIFVARSNPQFLYVTEGFSPNSVYKLDLTQVDAPLVHEDVHGNILNGGSEHLAINQDGANLFMASGQVLRTESLTQSGLIGRGVSTVSNDGVSALVGENPNSIGIYDTSTYLKTDRVFTTCNITDIDRILELQPGLQWVLLGQQTVCLVSSP